MMAITGKTPPPLPDWDKVTPTPTAAAPTKAAPVVTPTTLPKSKVPALPSWDKGAGAPTATGVSTKPELPIKPVPSPILEAELRGARRDLAQATRAAERYGVPAQTVENIVEQKEPNVGLKILGAVLNTPTIKYGVLKPLEILDVGRRAVVGTLSPNVGVMEAIKDPTLGSREAFNINVGDFKGSGVIEALLGFGTDVILDPVTYATFGTGGVVKGVASQLAKEGAMVTTKGIARTAIKQAGEAAVKQADDAARFAGQFLDDAQRAAIRESAETAARQSEELLVRAAPKPGTPGAAAVAAAEKAQRVGPRRVIGARSREELAQVAREVRDVAVQSGNDYVARTLSDDVIRDLATRGYSAARGDVARALGLRGGIRWGVGKAKVIIPGTEKLADSIGQVLTAVRIGAKTPLTDLPYLRNSLAFINKGFVGTKLGNAIIRNTTPIGEGGLFGSEQILDMRNALRTATYQGRKITGEEADDFVRLLAQDRAFRNLFAAAKTDAQQLLRPILNLPGYQKYSNTVLDLLDNPAVGENLATMTAADATAAVGRVVDDAELEVAKQLRVVGDEFYNRANYLYQRQQLMAGISEVNLKELPKNKAWFPHTLSDDARKAIYAGKVTDEELLELGVDRSFAMAGTLLRQLKVGSIWFGKKLTADDIAGGVKRLNEIARPRLGYDFFETNAEAAFNKYAQGWARDTSYTNFLYNMALATEARRGLKDTPLGKIAEAFGAGQFAGKAFEGEVTQEATKLVTKVGAPKRLESFVKSIEDVITPDRVRALNNIPVARERLQSIADQLVTLRNESATRLGKGGVLFSDQIDQVINNLEQEVLDLGRIVAPESLPPGYGSAISSEAEALLQSLRNEVDGIRLDFASVTPDKWAKSVPIFLDSANRFLQLNGVNYPGLIGSPQFTELVQNVRRLEDPVVARAMQRALGPLTGMFKAWVTSTPGFHVRNAMSNLFFMLSAGANPFNVGEASRIFTAYRKYLKASGLEGKILPADRAAREALMAPEEVFSSQSLADFAASDFAKGLGLDQEVAPGLTKLDVMLQSAGAGYGQIGDIFEMTGRLGITGRTQTGAGARAAASRLAGRPLGLSRDAGNFVETWSRFTLLYDGVKQGLSTEQAAARAAKYLIDYSDLSRADQVMRQFIPFWMWTSRSFPLILESAYANPRAYAVWNNLTRNLRDQEQEEAQIRPGYLRAAIPVGGNVLFNPDFGFQRQEEGFANLTDPRSILAGLNPALRAALELGTNREFRTGEELYSPYYQDPREAELQYLLRTLAPGLPSIGRATNAGIGALQQLANAAGAANQPELQAALERIALAPQQLPAPIKEATAIGKPSFVQEEQGPMYSQESLNRLLSFFGIPVTTLQPYQQTAEIKRLVERLEQETTRAKEEREKQRRNK